MNITILPYIVDTPVQNKSVDSTTKKKSVSNEKTDSTNTNTVASATNANFQETLNTVMKAIAAVAIDSLVKASAQGAVNTQVVQEFFDKNGINITLTSTSDQAVGGTIVESNNTASTSSTDVASLMYYNSSGTSNSWEMDSYFEEASKQYNVDVNFLKAIAYCESNFDPNAVSRAGAVGVMQLMPETAKELGVTNSYDARQNILGGAKLISQLINKYDGDLSLALAAYNAGSNNVDKYGGIPPFTETQNYVKKVLERYNSYN